MTAVIRLLAARTGGCDGRERCSTCKYRMCCGRLSFLLSDRRLSTPWAIDDGIGRGSSEHMRVGW